MSTTPRFFSGITNAELFSVAAIESIGPIAWQRVRSAYPTLQRALEDAGRQALTETQFKALTGRAHGQKEVEAVYKKYDIGILLLGQKQFPKLLSEIPDPPLWLFYRGDLSALDNSTISVVGSRNCSTYGAQIIEKLLPAELLAQLTTVSGLAYGIDKKVHEQSLRSSGKTVAVLAGGLDAIYPVDHTQLANKIIANSGLLLSEYPPLSRPKGYRFPIRNRIIAGLSSVTVVIEAAIQSGSLTTARSAIDYNRDVFAVPGDITRKSAVGTNFLLRQGATALVESIQLFEHFGLDVSIKADESLDSDQRQVLDLLIQDPKNIEQIAVVVNKPIEVVLGLVTQLELLNRVYQPKPGYYFCK